MNDWYKLFAVVVSCVGLIIFGILIVSSVWKTDIGGLCLLDIMEERGK